MRIQPLDLALLDLSKRELLAFLLSLLLCSSLRLREPDRLSQLGVLWGHEELRSRGLKAQVQGFVSF